MERDPRAVENPISAIFDLSEDVVAQAGDIGRAVRYATVFMGVWLVVNFLLVVIFFFNFNLLLFGLCAAVLILGAVSLAMLRKVSAFFSYYVVRHAAIKAVRDADPLVYAPQGATPAERLLAHLRATTPQLSSGVEFAVPGIVEGANRLQYKFDVYAKREPGALWKLLGVGEPGLALFVKIFETKPRPEDVVAFRKAVEGVCARTGAPPLRAIILWLNRAGDGLDDDTYAALMSNQVRLSGTFSSAACAIEMITELPTGEYDFAPFMAAPYGAQAPPAPQAHAAASRNG
jgi:hypothetical protein